jgi:hypothetical protein
LNVNKISYLSNITERITYPSSYTGGSNSTPYQYTLDFSGGSVFYIPSNTRLFDVCMNYNVINFPSLNDTTCTYTITTLIKGSSTITNANLYAGYISYSNTNIPSTKLIPIRFSTPLTNVFNTNASQIGGSISGNLVSQTIAYICQTDASFVFSNLSIFNN